MEAKPELLIYKEQRCECCSEQGALFFSTCPNCGHVVLVCDEVGTVFQNPHNLNNAVYGGIDDPTCYCVKCSEVQLSDFVCSVESNVIGVGFKYEQYKKST